MLEPGEEAPTFELPDQHGETVALADFRGQTVVLYFYPRADTPGCTTEACGFRDAWAEFEQRGVPVLGVSNDTVDALAEFVEKYDLPITLLSDEEGGVCEAYDSFSTDLVGDVAVTAADRNTFVIDEEGRIERVYEGVDPEGHAEEILADL
ncbi:peroxiredoxin [Halobacteriales archaeon QS_1_68_20]|nr:MAG: peroxiredoxin [Halobacteriales archaeon QS_1_68_20]